MADQEVPVNDLPENIQKPQASPSQLPSVSGQEVPSDDLPSESTPDTSAMKDYVTKNLATENQKQSGEQNPPREAKSFLEALEAGLQMSTAGLGVRGKMPDVVLPENSGRAWQIASQIGTLAGDLPAMVAGGALGGAVFGGEGAAAGSVVPGAGTVAGGVAGAALGSMGGAFAVPAALRKILIDHYEKGDITSPQEFGNRLMATSYEAIKGFATGAVTAATGGALAPVAGPLVGAGAELATMTTVGAAMEKHLPTPDDFINGAIVLGGLHGVSEVAPKLRNIYAATGERPEDVAQRSQSDIALKQDILSSDKTLPEQARPSELMHFSAAEGSLPSVESQAKAMGEKEQKPIPPPEQQWKLTPKEEPAPSGGSGGEQPPRSPEEQEILSKIGENPEAPQKTVKESLADFYQKNIDYLSPLKTAIEDAKKSGADIPAEDNAYQAGRRFAATSDLIRSFLEFGTRDAKTGELNGESLEKIFKDVPNGDLNSLRAYGMAKRGLELQGRGITPWKDFNAENAQKVADSYRPKLEAINQRRIDFENRVVDFTKDKGLVSEEQAQRIKDANQQHFAFNRVQDPDVFTGKVKGSTILKKIYGSEKEVLDPIESTYKNTEMMLRRAKVNEVRHLFLNNMRDGGLVDEGDGTNTEAYLRKVPAQMLPIDVKAEELSRSLSKQGISVTPEDITIFRPEQSYLKDNQVAIYTDGKKEVYEGDPGVISALKRLDGDPTSMDMWSKIMRGFATATRVGTVNNPTFGFSHFFRSQIMSAVYSKTGMIPFYHSALALKDFMSKSSDYQSWLYNGGASSSWFKIEDTYMKDKTFANAENPKTVAPFYGTAWNAIKKAGDATESFIKLTDNLSRLAEYKRSVAAGVSPQESAFRSREVVPDYQKVGLQRSMLRSGVAFIGAHINSLDRMAQELSDPQTRQGMIAKLSVISMISAGMWLVNKDDKAIEDLPDWQKNTYWNFNISRMTDQSSGGENEKSYIMRLPKPWAPGILAGSGVEVALDSYFKNNPNELKDFARSLTQSVIPEPIPNILAPVLEQASNKKLFSGAHVVPEDREKALPAFQVNPYTSETAKQLGKIIGAIPYVKDLGPSSDPLASPAVIQNYIESWGGTLGGYALRIADWGLAKIGIGNDQTHSMDDVNQTPLINKFVSMYPSWKSQTLEDFYNNKNDVEKILNSQKISNKEGDQATAQQLLLAHPEIDVKLDQIGQGISTARKFLESVRDNPNMSAEDKRQLEYTTLFQILSAAKMGNQQIEAFKQTQKSISH